MKQGEALKTVLLRNAFYRDGCKRLLFAVTGIVLLNLVLLGDIAYHVVNPPRPRYFPITPDGRIINIHPLSDPVVSNAFVLQWAANAARKAYSLDYLHWRGQLQEASNNFTPNGWKLFVSQLKSSNNLNTLIHYNMVSTASITGAPQLREHAVISGHYIWKISMPIYVTYTNGIKTIHQSAILTMLVVRMPVWQDPNRIAINNFIVNEQAT